jgi:hypothetical protein
MNAFDVFVSASRGEGFAIPVRLAQMMNKLIVAVRTGAVAELDPLNVIWVAAGIRRVAVYPEVNDSVYGHQFDAFKMDLRAALAIAADRAAAREGRSSTPPEHRRSSSTTMRWWRSIASCASRTSWRRA